MQSPYDNIPLSEWRNKTVDLVKMHPLSSEDIVSSVLESWSGILSTQIAGELQIGVDVFPSPQILGNYLHELVPVKLSKKYPQQWRREKERHDKDLVFIPNDLFSVEIKTSSNPKNVFGNRSYGQENSVHNSGKSKSGYYITVNFEKFEEGMSPPKVKIIRFGWIDHSDWKAQKSETGQAAPLSKEAREHKLLVLYDQTSIKRIKKMELF
ncbi:ScaI family restriction endonuclease [Paenibacillus polymyxa]|uniref:ScaI family restriction endonuclease n=1 Tax=Paenibacillus polymyxa TaxID=1406 RepID=UPI002018D473|nr:ScaI family restriction endonuclease [Paenibacillus polymyxa]UQQ35582.1 ScaI family restriction endonuclease [Paenibacillus polymyxa]